MKKKALILFLAAGSLACAQEKADENNTPKGEISFGFRTTGSMFSASRNYFSIGAGWQARYRMSKTLNTEWFFDWITTDIGGYGQRIDAHIGESMILYPGKRNGVVNTFTPYVMGGFCGDYAKVTANLKTGSEPGNNATGSVDRWSFATQLGVGTHYHLAERFDISFSAQYVLHYGRDIHSEISEDGSGSKYLLITREDGGSLEGHIFLSLSANLVLADLVKCK